MLGAGSWRLPAEIYFRTCAAFCAFKPFTMDSARSSSDTLRQSHDGLLGEKKARPRTLLAGCSFRSITFYALVSLVCTTIFIQCILMLEVLKVRGQSPVQSGDDINGSAPKCTVQFRMCSAAKANLLSLLPFCIYANHVSERQNGYVFTKLHLRQRHDTCASSVDGITSSYVRSAAHR